MAEKKSDFEVLQIMSSEDTKCVRMSPHLTNVNINGKNGFVTMGLDTETAHDLMNGDYIAVLYVVEKEKFFSIKNG